MIVVPFIGMWYVIVRSSKQSIIVMCCVVVFGLGLHMHNAYSQRC